MPEKSRNIDPDLYRIVLPEDTNERFTKSKCPVHGVSYFEKVNNTNLYGCAHEEHKHRQTVIDTLPGNTGSTRFTR